MMMTMDDVKEAKAQCESEIRAIINMFEIQSGCCVHGVDLMRVHTIGYPPKIEVVTFDVRLLA